MSQPPFAPWQASIEDYSAAEIGRLEDAAEVQTRAAHGQPLGPQRSHASAPQCERAEAKRCIAPPRTAPPLPRLPRLQSVEHERRGDGSHYPTPNPTPTPHQAEEHEREEEMEVMIKWTIVLSLMALGVTYICGFLLELRHIHRLPEVGISTSSLTLALALALAPILTLALTLTLTLTLTLIPTLTLTLTRRASA